MAYEEPEYRILDQREDYELRAYEPYLAAETTVEGSFGQSGNQAFRILAAYIFGKNRQSEKMAMTAPVTRQPADTDERVKSEASATIIAEQAAGAARYTYQFVMERKYTRDMLPDPDDSRVRIREIPARTLAARRYSGRWTEENFRKHAGALLDALRRDGIEAIGMPQSAAYNSPFTPPFLRRNEVLIEVERP